MLRIIAGEFRSRLLATPPDADITRPMTDRARESVFNLLRGWFDDAAVIDLFAGVGSMGLEAISRGASHVTFVERDAAVARFLRRNVESLGCADHVAVIVADATRPETLDRITPPIQIVFCDPPYPMMHDERQRLRILEQVARCRALMTEGGFLVLRTPLDPAETAHPIDGFDGPEVHRMGAGMWVLLYAPRDASA